MKTRVTVRMLDGKPYKFLDVGCKDLEQAEWNRAMVANKRCIEAYLEIEAMVARTKGQLPSKVIGSLPGAGGT